MPKDFQVTLPKEGGDFAINLFDLTGYACIVKIEVDGIDIPPDDAISLEGNRFWNPMAQATVLTPEEPNADIGMGSCCWSAAVSSKGAIQGVAPTTAGPDGVTLDFKVFGVDFECSTLDSSEQGSSYVPCDPIDSSSSSSS